MTAASASSAAARETQDRLDFAVAVAREASELILRYYQSVDLAVDLKGDQSPVTAADRGAEQLIRERLADRFPNDGVLGEEFGEHASRNGYRWILDPVDGTKSFVHGVPLFGTLIGIEHEEKMAAGVCRIPAMNEVVYAARGTGCWWQQGAAPPRRAQVSSVARFSDALFCFTEFEGFTAIDRPDAFLQLVNSARLTRGWGDCYGHVLVATGRADVMVDPRMNPWDAAALIPLVEEAGGRFFDWTGASTINGGNGCSSNAPLREQTLELLKRR